MAGYLHGGNIGSFSLGKNLQLQFWPLRFTVNPRLSVEINRSLALQKRPGSAWHLRMGVAGRPHGLLRSGLSFPHVAGWVPAPFVPASICTGATFLRPSGRCCERARATASAVFTVEKSGSIDLPLKLRRYLRSRRLSIGVKLSSAAYSWTKPNLSRNDALRCSGFVGERVSYWEIPTGFSPAWVWIKHDGG